MNLGLRVVERVARTYTCAHETEPSASSYFDLDNIVLQVNVMTVVSYTSTHSGPRVRPVCHGGAYDRHLYSYKNTLLVKGTSVEKLGEIVTKELGQPGLHGLHRDG